MILRNFAPIYVGHLPQQIFHGIKLGVLSLKISESTLRKNYLPKDYDMVIKQIRNSIGNNDIWISVDETTDRLGRYIVHLVIGKLSSEEAGHPFLLALKQLDKTNLEIYKRIMGSAPLTKERVKTKPRRSPRWNKQTRRKRKSLVALQDPSASTVKVLASRTSINISETPFLTCGPSKHRWLGGNRIPEPIKSLTVMATLADQTACRTTTGFPDNPETVEQIVTQTVSSCLHPEYVQTIFQEIKLEIVAGPMELDVSEIYGSPSLSLDDPAAHQQDVDKFVTHTTR
ncbi:hypothetical protein Zmor_023583 [Zophobas morio]|uniref:Uncharacterized protein n=1 Tax=Zophobas morio TaxID=2755281 RepID=A0AA38M836_9CUCU|nr:hypothetical protein Zmor_023583 [Zophobas morio]